MIGCHSLVDFYGVAEDKLNDAQLLENCLLKAAQAANLTPIHPPTFHLFPGGGMTGFLLLSESHIALHTYPEFGYIAIDIFSCSTAHPHLAIAVFRYQLVPVTEEIHMLPRGQQCPK